MKYLFLEYPKCSTCRKAKQWLDMNHVDYDDRHIIEQNPTEPELKEWIARSKQPLKNFFNTSGEVYRELQLKDKLASMSEKEQIRLLASNGKLIKRPLLVSNSLVLVGFNADDWKRTVM